MAVREDLDGRLVEKAALDFDLRNPLAIRPKTARVDDGYGDRAAMPERVELQNVAFEGFLVRREVVDAIGLPGPDVLHLLRRRRLRAARPARRLPDLGGPRRRAGAPARLRPAARLDTAGRATTCTATSSSCTSATARTCWSGQAVADHAAVVLLSPLRGGRAEARNVIRAIRRGAGNADRATPTTVD